MMMRIQWRFDDIIEYVKWWNISGQQIQKIRNSMFTVSHFLLRQMKTYLYEEVPFELKLQA